MKEHITADRAIGIYKDLFNPVMFEGMELNTKKCKSGFLVLLSYNRNEYHSELEDKVLITSEGLVYRDHKLITKTSTRCNFTKG